MRLTTEDLILRTAEPEDGEEAARLWDMEQGPIPRREAEKVLERMEENHQKNRPGQIYHLCLAVAEREDPKTFIGWCGLDGTSGDQMHLFYSIVPERRGRGFATQAARALLDYAFQRAGVPFVNGGCCRDNRASYRVMEKAGMARAGEDETGGPLFYLDRETYLAQNRGLFIREALPEDVEDVYRLICLLEEVRFPYEDFREIFRRQREGGSCTGLICQTEGRTVGFLNLRMEEQLHHCGTVAEVLELSVDPACRSQGIGKALLDRARSLAVERGCLVLEVSSSHRRAGAHRFYLREGMADTHKTFTQRLAGE